MVTINMQSGNTNLLAYFNSWYSNYTYFDDGYFYPASGTHSQFAIGETNPHDTSSSAILDGTFTYSIPGIFNGTIGSLNLSHSLTGDSSTGFGQATPVGLEIEFNQSISASDTWFTEAIYVMANYGSFTATSTPFGTMSGFFDYFDTVGVTINGTTGADTIDGFAGDDYIDGKDLGDTIFGNGGNDEIHGGSGEDYLYGGDGNDTIYGENHIDRLYGGQGNDTLDGGAFADFLYGGNGNDRLIGGTGNDNLWGGHDNDTFVYDATNFGLDTIHDFDAGTSTTAVDIIEFKTSVFANWAAVQAKISTVGSNSVITLNAGNTITLLNVAASDLDASDFTFVV